MSRLLKFLPFLLLLGLGSCGGNHESADSSLSDVSFEAISKDAEANQLEEEQVIQRKLIKDGSIHFETNDINKTRSHIYEVVNDLNAYISNDQVYDNQNRIDHTITIRVPSKHFDLLLDKISQEAHKIDNKSINTVDVTEEYIDIEARIKTKKELEEKYINLLERTNSIDDIIRIEKELGDIRADIESIEGRLNYLKDRVTYSTLNIQFYETHSESFKFFNKLGKAVKQGWSNLLWFFIVIANLWAFIVGGIVIFYIIKYYSNKKNDGQQPPTLNK